MYQPPVPSIYTLLTHHADTRGKKTALVNVDVDTEERVVLTYRDLLRQVVQTAHLLHSCGIKENDRFAILMQNTLEILLFELAGGILGATTVPLDYKRDTFDRKLFKLSDTGAKTLFIKALQETEEIKTLSNIVKTELFSSYSDFLTLITKQPVNSRLSPVNNLEHRYLILYTSGTTALPKGVPLSVRALIANAEGIVKWQGLTDQDSFNIILPLHHINSTTMSLATLLAGGTVVLSSRYSTSKFWSTIAQEKCTITSVVPTIIHDLLTRKDEFLRDQPHISSMKRILIGSAPVLPEETLRFYQTFKVRVVQGYGQTETALRVTGVPVDLSEKEYVKAVKTNAIGEELSNCDVTIRRKDGSETEAKEEGEICIRGPVLADGYWNNPEETQKTFHDGWFHSGDLGYYEYRSTPVISIRQLTERNLVKRNNKVKYFYIIGRLKEIIIKGGINLSPVLIEDALLKKFAEIEEVSVVGIPDERMGEEVAAVVVPKKHVDVRVLERKVLEAGQQDKITGLSHYEVPQKIFFVGSLPKTSTGKIQRVEVKKTVAGKIKHEKPSHLYVRQIKPDEVDVLKSALKINNARWQGLPATLSEFSARAQNGLLFGVFGEKKGLLGTISCVQLPLQIVKRLKTWKEATGNGTLANHDDNGDTLLCVAISVKSDSLISSINPIPPTQTIKLQRIAKQKIAEYVNSSLDHVLEFHRKPKGGLPGATVWKILENGRPDDKESMGYNVLMKYPEITKGTKIVRSNAASPSILLIEHVLSYAQKHGIKHVIAFSRPIGLRDYLTRVGNVVEVRPQQT